VPAVTEYWYDELKITQPGDESRGWPLLILLGALGIAFGEAHDLARDPDQLSDPARIPIAHLPWLAQWAGVTIPDGTPEAQARALVTSPPAFRRGTVGALIDAVRVHHPAPKRLEILERADGNAHRLGVFTYASQTTDEAVTRNDIESQTPAWITLVYGNYPGWAIGVMEREYAGQTIAALEAAFSTISDLEGHIVP
jgi:hypothetical protein